MDILYFKKCCQYTTDEDNYFGVEVNYLSAWTNGDIVAVTVEGSTICGEVIDYSIPSGSEIYSNPTALINYGSSCSNCVSDYPCVTPTPTPIPNQPQPINECNVVTIFPMEIECVTINPSSSTADDGYMSVSITGGTPPYTIIWSNGNISPAIENLTIGTYTATVIDYYGDFTATTTCELTHDLDCEFGAVVSNFTTPPTPTPTPTTTATPTPTTTPHPTPNVSPSNTPTPTPTPTQTPPSCVRPTGLENYALLRGFSGTLIPSEYNVFTSYLSACDAYQYVSANPSAPISTYSRLEVESDGGVNIGAVVYAGWDESNCVKISSGYYWVLNSTPITTTLYQSLPTINPNYPNVQIIKVNNFGVIEQITTCVTYNALLVRNCDDSLDLSTIPNNGVVSIGDYIKIKLTPSGSARPGCYEVTQYYNGYPIALVHSTYTDCGCTLAIS